MSFFNKISELLKTGPHQIIDVNETSELINICKANIRYLEASHKTASALLIAYGAKKSTPKAIELKKQLKFIDKKLTEQKIDLHVYSNLIPHE